MERACERVHTLASSGEKAARADWLACWLGSWLADLPGTISTNRAKHDKPCGAVPRATRPAEEDSEPLPGAWWGIWPRRSCDQSEVEMDVSSAPEKVRSRVWVQAWIWRHALPKAGQPEAVRLGRYSDMVRMCGKMGASQCG